MHPDGQTTEDLWVAMDDGCSLANETQRMIWSALCAFLGADFGVSHEFDGHFFESGHAAYQYALLTRPNRVNSHMINSRNGQPWREIGIAPSRTMLCVDDHEFAKLRVQSDADANCGWAWTPLHKLA